VIVLYTISSGVASLSTVAWKVLWYHIWHCRAAI